MRYDPLMATYVGDQRYNDQLPIATDEAFHAWREQLIGFRTRLEGITPQKLSKGDQLNYELFKHLVENDIAEIGFNAHRMPISRTGGFHLMFPDTFQVMPFTNQQDYANYVSRLEAFKRYALENVELMRLGLRTGFLPPACTLVDMDKQLKAQLVTDATKSVFYQPFRHFPPQIGEQERKKLAESAEKAILGSIVPGYQAILQFVQQEYLPAARESIASIDLPNGDAFYAHRIYYFTSLHLTAQQVHQTGVDEVKRIRAEMDRVIKKTGWTGDMTHFLEFLRTDPRFYVTTPEALLEKTALVLKRMDGELPPPVSRPYPGCHTASGKCLIMPLKVKLLPITTLVWEMAHVQGCITSTLMTWHHAQSMRSKLYPCMKQCRGTTYSWRSRLSWPTCRCSGVIVATNPSWKAGRYTPSAWVSKLAFTPTPMPTLAD